MIQIIVIGLAILAVALAAALQRRQGQWPREGHGVTYFARHSLRR